MVLFKIYFPIKLQYYRCQSWGRDTQVRAASLKWPFLSPGFHRFHQILSDDAEVLQYGFDVGEGIDRLSAHLHVPGGHLWRLQAMKERVRGLASATIFA